MPSSRILFISNGIGEDRIACGLIRVWQKQQPQDHISAIAMVGNGLYYQKNNILLLTAPLNLPSEGFAYMNPALLLKDIQGGLLKHLYNHYQTLKKMRHQVDLTIAVGDIVPIIAACLLPNQFVFVGCALSDHYLDGKQCTYDPLQLFLLRKNNTMVFPRDRLTHQHLLERGIRTFDVGNPMLDCVDYRENWQSPEGKIQVAVLPGSHIDMPNNFQQILSYISHWNTADYHFLVVISPHFAPHNCHLFLENWGWKKQGSHWSRYSMTLSLESAEALGNIFQVSQVAIGLSGTANEQAVGHGIPVISFATTGKQYTHCFAEAQQRLLGDGLIYLKSCDSNILITKMTFALENQNFRRNVQEVAKARFGKPGATERIIEKIRGE